MPLTLDALDARLAERAAASLEESYTAKLISGGTAKCAQKLGEEAVETVIAAMAHDREELVKESADLIYHWLVLLRAEGVPLANVMDELERRTAQSGLEEKAARGSAEQ
ncbi:phosphoribosyl-ATP diphosphatase [Pelagibacterium xiamenense]|uniref:phosphoribosyl-ATP diphosphatase n=1 Tax=Pelagibacterium xiamenense TaxID=2901140 RepID=UPI001E2FFD12|nr:phosphoribosyl-ATP diphosphatase [Pelagibacterium xiamenense]MCD7058448.1 phosphoribosyl-ATP diphosphatase [Pelagibacterium xiamenense]